MPSRSVLGSLDGDGRVGAGSKDRSGARRRGPWALPASTGTVAHRAKAVGGGRGTLCSGPAAPAAPSLMAMSEPRDGTTAGRNRDGSVQRAVLDELAWTPGLEVAGIGVSVHNGVVTLNGDVDDV